MADISPDAIVCRFNSHAGQWLAHFEHASQVAFGGDKPLLALRRLLEGTEAEPGEYNMRWDQEEPTGTDAPFWTAMWQPPELLYQCPDCEGKGQYIGMANVELCRTCGGRNVIPV